MKWTSSIGVSESFENGLRAAIDETKQRLGRADADLGFLFVSHAFRQQLIDLWPTLVNEVPVKTLIGCTGGGIIGNAQEVEDRAAVSLITAVLPGVAIRSFDVRQADVPSADAGPRAWRSLINTASDGPPQFVILSDPFSMDADALVSGLDFAYPDSATVGGLASGGLSPNENLIIHGSRILHAGAVGVALSGNISMEPVVAQGCRPIGEPLKITEANDNMLLSVNGVPPLHYLSDLYMKLGTRDKELLTHSLFLGLVTDAFKEAPKQGDFLIRNIVGVDQERGVLAIGARLRQGQTVQFHLRDALTSHDDLRLMLGRSETAAERTTRPDDAAMGAVLFSCLGRGARLYGQPHHDVTVLKSLVGDIPVAGFFCNGEIGPIGGKTYLHGYTSSIGFFRSAEGTAT